MELLNYYFKNYMAIVGDRVFPKHSYREIGQKEISIIIFFKDMPGYLKINSDISLLRRIPTIAIEIYDNKEGYLGDETHNLVIVANKCFKDFIKEMKIEDLEILKMPNPEDLDHVLAVLTFWAANGQTGDGYATKML